MSRGLPCTWASLVGKPDQATREALHKDSFARGTGHEGFGSVDPGEEPGVGRAEAAYSPPCLAGPVPMAELGPPTPGLHLGPQWN